MTFPFDAIPRAFIRRLATLTGKPGVAHKFDPDAAGVGDGFSHVGHYTGELLNLENVERELGSYGSSALLAFESETDPGMGNSLLTGYREHIGQATWAVIVIVRDSRGSVAATGAPNAPGVYDLCGRVQRALTNADLLDEESGEELLWHSSRVRFLGKRPLFQRPTLTYGVAVRFATLYDVDSIDIPWATVPRQYAADLTTLRLRLHLRGFPGTTPPDPAQLPPEPFDELELTST